MSEDKSQGGGGADNEEKKALTWVNESADGGPDMDSSKVKFINGGTADPTSDAKVEMGDSGKDDEFVGLTKDELMKYANDPYWVRVRWVLLILFWVAWFAMLVAAIIIIVVAPRCPHRPNLEWWQKDVIYKTYTRSFKDSSGDGNGDLKGIHDKLDYVKKNVKANAILLSSILKSPEDSIDLGYDPIDFKAIDERLGDMKSFDDLRLAVHNKGMHLVMDFIPNHSSDKHPWFVASRNNRSDDNPYKDYYVWADGKGSNPPNNWLSVYGGPAWTRDDRRGQWYLHQFTPEQPDLNLRSEKVQEELKDILNFWLGKKVDGFRIDSLAHLFESNDTSKDEPRNPNVTNAQPSDYRYLDHKHTAFQPETYEITAQWRKLLDSYFSDGQGYKFLLGEVEGNADQVAMFYKKGVDMPQSKQLAQLKDGCGGQCVRDIVNSYMTSKGDDQWGNWALGDDETSRVGSRVGEKYVNAANMLALTLPGTATTYYGEEIGMEDTRIGSGDKKDKISDKYRTKSRDPQRTPMQWTTDNFAGFTDGELPWLPVNGDFVDRNVKGELAHGAGVTTLEAYAKVSALRKEPSLSWGKLKEAVVSDNIYSFVRQAEGFDGFLIAINFGDNREVVDFVTGNENIVAKEGKIVATTANFDVSRVREFEVDLMVKLDGLHLEPGEGVVFKWPADAVGE